MIRSTSDLHRIFSCHFCPLKGFLMCRRYGLLNFLWDCFMTLITCGFWIIWIFVREMRNH